MNYYPNNFYQNYPYNNTYQPQSQQTQIGVLQGKIVDSIDMVKANEVPFGGFGIFPKGDLSEIYVKSWSNNGTTQINTYKAIPKTEEIKEINIADINNSLLEKITILNEKIDLLMNNNTTQNNPSSQKPVEKGVNKIDAY